MYNFQLFFKSLYWNHLCTAVCLPQIVMNVPVGNPAVVTFAETTRAATSVAAEPATD